MGLIRRGTLSLRGLGLVALGLCMLAAWLDPQPARWGAWILWLASLGLVHGALLSLWETDPERQVDHLCCIHLSWAVLGGAAHALAPEALADAVRGPLVCQVLAHALLVPGLATWMDRRRDDLRSERLGADGLAFGLVAVVAVAGGLAGVTVVDATWQLHPLVGRLSAVGVAMTVAAYARILAHGGPPRS